MSITNEEIDATRATLRDTVTEALLGSISEGRLNVAEWEAALDALVEFERAEARYSSGEHQPCEWIDCPTTRELRAIIDKVNGEA